MKIISFTDGQHGEEWLAWRKNGIGASDISVITRSNPYKTRLQLWEIKCGFREEDPINPAMQHGIDNEAIARGWMNEHFQLNLQPICIEDPDNPEFRASLDGFDFDTQTLVEIKCPISEGTLDKARLTQSIHKYWFDQVQWQIMLCQPKRAIVALWDYKNNCCITVEMFGIKENIQKMRKLATSFWHDVQIGKPPEPEKDDYIRIEDDKLHEYLLEYKDTCEREKAFTGRKNELKELITSYGDGGNFYSYGFKVQKLAVAARYDIAQMKLDGVDIDKYIKKSDSQGYYRIYVPKK